MCANSSACSPRFSPSSLSVLSRGEARERERQIEITAVSERWDGARASEREAGWEHVSLTEIVNYSFVREHEGEMLYRGEERERERESEGMEMGDERGREREKASD